jgi:NADH-quinone oxidoreductase subunit D
MADLRSETMTVNMGPQHPSTHGVLRLVLELDGENIVSAEPTIGFLHTGIEKTAEQKKWQQVDPARRAHGLSGRAVEQPGVLLSVEKLIGLEMPDRVDWIRVLIAELQRLSSHLVWLGTHGMEVGAVSVMLYCFREREQLLNINEMIAGFRMFPSYLRIGGLREDLPRGFHKAVKDFLDAFPAKLDDYERLLTKNQVWVKRTKGVGRLSREDTMAMGIVGPMARAVGIPYDVRKMFPYLKYETFDFRVPTQTDGDVYARYLVKVEEMRQSVKICKQALERITPTGVFDCGDYRYVPPPEGPRVHGDGGADSALPAVLAGFQRPEGRGYVPVEGPRGEHGFYSCRTAPIARCASSPARPRSSRARRLPKMIVGG